VKIPSFYKPGLPVASRVSQLKKSKAEFMLACCSQMSFQVLSASFRQVRTVTPGAFLFLALKLCCRIKNPATYFADKLADWLPKPDEMPDIITLSKTAS
jgi:hypothetical protein